MDVSKVQGYLMVMRYWSESAWSIVTHSPTQTPDWAKVESALRLIEGKIEAVREEINGRDPVEPESLSLTDQARLQRPEEEHEDGC